jgi:hypothetical protein
VRIFLQRLIHSFMKGFGMRDVLAMTAAPPPLDDLPLGMAISLPHAAAAVAVNEAAKNRCRQVVHLPASALVLTRGDGFNQRTIEVSYQGQLYFMFRQDLTAGEPDVKAREGLAEKIR